MVIRSIDLKGIKVHKEDNSLLDVSYKVKTDDLHTGVLTIKGMRNPFAEVDVSISADSITAECGLRYIYKTFELPITSLRFKSWGLEMDKEESND